MKFFIRRENSEGGEYLVYTIDANKKVSCWLVETLEECTMSQLWTTSKVLLEANKRYSGLTIGAAEQVAKWVEVEV